MLRDLMNTVSYVNDCQVTTYSVVHTVHRFYARRYAGAYIRYFGTRDSRASSRWTALALARACQRTGARLGIPRSGQVGDNSHETKLPPSHMEDV